MKHHPPPDVWQWLLPYVWRIARETVLRRLVRGTVPLLVVALACASCDNLPGLNQVWTVAETSLFGQPDVPIQRSTVETLPYASIRAKMGRGGRVLMILGRYDGPDLHWISADRAAIATRGGRIVKTAGFPENLKETRFVGDDPVNGHLNQLNGARTIRRLIDIDTENRYGVQVVSTLQPVGEETIEILDRTYRTLLIREVNQSDQLDWEFDNYYWVDPETGFVWKTIQSPTPDLPPIEIEILKPAA